MHPFNQRNTLVRNSVINTSRAAAAAGGGGQGQETRTGNGMVINPDCDCPKCRRAARTRNLGNGQRPGLGARVRLTRRDEARRARTLAMGLSRSRSNTPLVFKTKFYPSKPNPNYDDEEGAEDSDRDPEPEQTRRTHPQQVKEDDSTTKFVLTPRKMVYTPPPQPKQQLVSGRSGNGDCRHIEKEHCCVYCRTKLGGNGRISQNSWIPTPSPRLPSDRTRTAVISKVRALQPVYSAPTCTCFHEVVDEETPRFQNDNENIEMEEQEQELYDDENENENEEMETLIKPQARPRQENPIRTRFRQLQQQEARVRRVPIPSRYMTDLQTRIEKSINIYVYRNGIESLPPALIHIPPSRKQNMRAVMSVIQDRMKYPIGYAKTLYKMDGSLVRHPCELELYEKYVVASSYQKCFKSIEYGRVRSPLLVLGSESKNIHVRSKRNSYEDWKKKWKLTGVGKCPLPAEDARSREILAKPHSLKTCIPVKVHGLTPRLSMLQTSTKDEVDERPNDQSRRNQDSNKTSNLTLREHSEQAELFQTKSEPKWNQNRNRKASGDLLGAGDSMNVRIQEEHNYISGDEESENTWEDKFFANSKHGSSHNHYGAQKSRPPVFTKEQAKEELLEDMSEPELIDDDGLMSTARDYDPPPIPSKSYTLNGPTVLPTGTSSEPCFGESGMTRSQPPSDFNYQHAIQMQYIPGTWFQVPSASGANYPTFAPSVVAAPQEGRGRALTKSTSTSDIPYGNGNTPLQFSSRTQLRNRLDSAQRMLREIPEIQIPFTPPAVPKYSAPGFTPRYYRTHNHVLEPESLPPPAATVWKPSPPPPPKVTVQKRNVAIQMGVSSLGEDHNVFPFHRQNVRTEVVYGAQNCQNTTPSYPHLQDLHSRDNLAPASTSQYHQQYLSPQVVVLVPPQEGRGLSKAASTRSQQQYQHQQSHRGSGYFK